MKLNQFLIAAACAVTLASNAGAQQGTEQLGTNLTPIGAEKAGNAAGTIPAWTGGLNASAGKVDKLGFRDNPFAAEKPVLVIDRKNFEQHKAQLTAGQIAMLKRYPDTYKINVYPTHRSAAYPASETAATRQNATSVKLIADGNGLANYQRGVPFPLPKSGLEVVWNHLTKYMGTSFTRNIIGVAPLANGEFTPIVIEQDYSRPSALTDYQAKDHQNMLYYYKQRYSSPARYAGEVTLVHETLDQVKEARSAWIYNPGQRRVRRAPRFAYDSPTGSSEGQFNTDNYQMYNGAPDQYEWTLVGKREVYIPYNSYALDNPQLKYGDIIKAGHLNSDHVRYELHRVWVVEANLKKGTRNVYARRTFYIDEDTWQISLADLYDSRGQLWRVAEGYIMQAYDIDIPLQLAEACYDLFNGRYYTVGLRNEMTVADDYSKTFSAADFSPGALRISGIR